MPIGGSLHEVGVDRLRGLAFLSLSDEGRVLTRTLVDSGGGGARGTYSPGDAIPCRIDPFGGTEGQTADRMDERTTHVATLPPGTAVRAADRFAVTRGSHTGGTYEITAVRTRTQEQVRVIELTEDF